MAGKLKLAPAVMIAAILVLDRIAKLCVSSFMTPGESIPMIGNVFRLTYVRNRGAAFSIFSGHTAVLAALTGIVIAAMLIYIFFRSDSLLISVPLSMIAGGGTGNLYDRIRYGYVTDMLDLRSFAVFNVADIFVCCGCVLLCVSIIFFAGRKNG